MNRKEATRRLIRYNDRYGVVGDWFVTPYFMVLTRLMDESEMPAESPLGPSLVDQVPPTGDALRREFGEVR